MQMTTTIQMIGQPPGSGTMMAMITPTTMMRAMIGAIAGPNARTTMTINAANAPIVTTNVAVGNMNEQSTDAAKETT
jgi:hypothetical protein